MKKLLSLIVLVLGFSQTVYSSVQIEDLFVQPDPKTGQIHIQTTVSNDSQEPARGNFVFIVAPAVRGKRLDMADIEQNLEPGNTLIKSTLQVDNPHLWDINDPYLYRVMAQVTVTGSDTFDEQSTRCGFRDFRLENGYFRLNGRRILLHSVLATRDTPFYSTKPFDPKILRKDMLHLKAMGINMMRFVVGGPARKMQLDMADEVGMMIFEEHSESHCVDRIKADTPTMLDNFDKALAYMIKRDRNHPSIVMWGLLNEERNNPIFQHAVTTLPLVRALDNSRPVILNSGRLDGFTRESQGKRGPGPATWRNDWQLVPNVTCNTTDETITVFESDYGGGSILDLEGSTWQPGQCAMHPGLNGEYSVVRWTAPETDTYSISAEFTGMVPRATTDLHIFNKGESVYEGSIDVAGGKSSAAFQNTITVIKGDTIDVVVGNGNEFPCREGVNSTCVCDNTMLNLTIISGSGKTYDVAADFSPRNNPNDPWSYGYLSGGVEYHDLPKHIEHDLSTFTVYAGLPFERGVIVGTLSNPGSDEWQDVLSDRHRYKRIPHRPEDIHELRTISDEKCPVFMTEYGAGSGMDLMRLPRLCEQHGTRGFDRWQKMFLADWNRWNLAEPFGRPEDYFIQSLAANADKRTLGMNALRSNPNIIGHIITGDVESTTGLGMITTFREFKPGIVDAVIDGCAPLRWCLFVEPVNVYRRTRVRMEAVLSNEDVLSAGDYPVRLRVIGPDGRLQFDQRITVTINDSEKEPPFAIPVFDENVVIDGPSGRYRFAVNFERGAAATGGVVEFYVDDAAQMPPVETEVVLWGKDDELAKWLKGHGIRTRPFDADVSGKREVILVSRTPADPGGRAAFRQLVKKIGQGSAVVFLCPDVFRNEVDQVGWLPLVNKSNLADLGSPAWPKDDWVKNHPIFDALPCGMLMDHTFYREIIPDVVWVRREVPAEWTKERSTTGRDLIRFDQDEPAEVVAGAINTGYGYESGLMVSVYDLGAGRFILNTLRIRENLGTDPVAERLLRNMLRYAGRNASKPLVSLPDDFDTQLKALGL